MGLASSSTCVPLSSLLEELDCLGVTQTPPDTFISFRRVALGFFCLFFFRRMSKRGLGIPLRVNYTVNIRLVWSCIYFSLVV